MVVLTEEGWAHVLARHDDMAPFQQAIRVAVEEDNEVFQDGRYPHHDEHYLETDSHHPSLKVVARSHPIAPSGWIGEVITAVRTRRKGKGDRRIWP